MGKLSTHILDVARGCPAAGVPIALYRIGEPDVPLVSCTSNSDGRTDVVLLADIAFQCGEYELVFHVASYFYNAGLVVSKPAFLDRIAIRFFISNAEENYHVPLLVSPWSYSTYRGS